MKIQDLQDFVDKAAGAPDGEIITFLGTNYRKSSSDELHAITVEEKLELVKQYLEDNGIGQNDDGGLTANGDESYQLYVDGGEWIIERVVVW